MDAAPPRERLYHVSEEGAIALFTPRPAPVLEGEAVVWAVNERCLPNYLFPRDCPRIAWHVAPHTTAADRQRHFTDPAATHAVAFEEAWLERMRTTPLYLYEFAPDPFALHDVGAGYFLARQPVRPISLRRIDDPVAELFARKVELHPCETLWQHHDAIQGSTFYWSIIRMRNAGVRG